MILGLVVLGLVALFFLAEYIMFFMAFKGRAYMDITTSGILDTPAYHGKKDMILDGIAYTNSIPGEDVYIASHDGLKLHARYFKAENERAVMILCHGYRSIAVNDFSCAVKYYHQSGMSVILIDQRAHGKSEGRAISFGLNESRDVKKWAEYAAERFPGAPIILDGLSMGASTVLLAASGELPESVVGVMADCGFTSAREIISHVIKQMKLPPKHLYPLVRLSAMIYGGFDPDEKTVTESVKNARLPALFIHGEADEFVPCHMGRRNFEAYGGEKRIITVPDAEHGLSYVVDTEGVQKVINEFFSDVLKEK